MRSRIFFDLYCGRTDRSARQESVRCWHWLIASSDNTFTYDVLVADLGGKNYEIDNIDPDDAEKISGGQLRARKLSVEEALRKYGNESHHSSVSG